MKLIIEIDEDVYKKIVADKYAIYDKMFYSIKNGIPIPDNAIPDNATNGDVLISLYTNLKYTIQNGRVVTTIGVASSFDLDWWNSPYQKGGTNEK